MPGELAGDTRTVVRFRLALSFVGDGVMWVTGSGLAFKQVSLQYLTPSHPDMRNPTKVEESRLDCSMSEH